MSLERIGLIMGIIASIPATWLVIRGWIAWAKSRFEREKRLTAIAAASQQILAEFSPNGGGTMRDAINRIEDRIAEGNERFDSLEQRVGRLETCPDCKRLRMASDAGTEKVE